MTSLRARIQNEDGLAMVMAVGIMATMLVLTAIVFGSANLTGRSTSADNARKRAFEAAEAGLQATVYRLNMLAPADNRCIGGTDSSVQAPTGAACAPHTESVGNGATYTTWTTTTLAQGGTCAGLQVGTQSSIAERCVTSAGTVNGVTRRVQTRVASYATAPPFPIAGVVGLRSVIVDQSTHIMGGTGSNGQITYRNTASSTTTTYGPSAPNAIVMNNANPGVQGRRSSTQGPFVLAPVDPGSSATSSDDVRLSNALASPRVSPFDSVGNGVTWNAATRTLTLANNASVTLGGAIYNFCKLVMNNNSTITLAAGARTAIYIDSPARAGSGCPAGTGTITVTNGASLVNNSPPQPGSPYAHDSTALQLYIVGLPGVSVDFANGAAFYGTIYAPTSQLNLYNTAGTWGAVAANDVYVQNNAMFFGDANTLGITANNNGLYFRTAWRECLANAPTTDPGSGC